MYATPCKVHASNWLKTVQFNQSNSVQFYLAVTDGYTVYVYTPLMVIYEKLRALCQQVEYYSTHIVSTHRRGRARDFFDIYSILEKLPKFTYII
jgi:hypothetical protein